MRFIKKWTTSIFMWVASQRLQWEVLQWALNRLKTDWPEYGCLHKREIYSKKCKSTNWPKTKNEHILNLTQESECSMGRQQYECFQNLHFHISSIPQQSTSICFVSQEKLPSKETAKKSSQLLPFCHIGNSKLGSFYSPQVVSSDLPLLVSSVVRYYPPFGIV